MYLLIVFLFLILSFSFFFIHHLCLFVCLVCTTVRTRYSDISILFDCTILHTAYVRCACVCVTAFVLTLPGLCLPLHTRLGQCGNTTSLSVNVLLKNIYIYPGKKGKKCLNFDQSTIMFPDIICIILCN